MKPLIRQENPADIPSIHALTKAAFLNAPHTAHAEQFIVDALRAAKALSASLVADDNGNVVGHVAISPVSIPDNTQGWYGLGPVSVSPALQRQGIGSRLMADVVAAVPQAVQACKHERTSFRLGGRMAWLTCRLKPPGDRHDASCTV
jgi:putative acetyltransferase